MRLCGRGHQNIRLAEVCSVCGSRELSMPQRQPSTNMRIFHVVALIIPFVVLTLFTLAYLAVFVKSLFTNPQAVLPLMLLGLVLGLLWLLWIQLSSFLKRLLFGQSGREKRK